MQLDGQGERIEALQSEIEQDLQLVGATAIEDKLQDEVEITISKLKESGIKVWVLTGDKVETAINIGYSCKLLDDSLIQLHITGKGFSEVSASLDEKMAIIRGSHSKKMGYALIISGDALVHAMRSELSKKVVTIGEICQTVLACRVSPKQKQEIVTLVRREKPQANTLAIGDGANDVNMIVAANVGIGIKGLEGHQAARASDFAIGEFRILRRLLYFYGRESYRRNSYLVLYNFYKNLLYQLPQFFIGFASYFSGTFLFEQVTFQFYNTLFTSMPIVLYAVFDREYLPSVLINSPRLYVQGMKNMLFNHRNFIKWFCLGVWESAVIALIAFGSLSFTFISSSKGHTFDYYGPGMLIFSTSIFVVNAKVLTMSNTFNFLNVFIVFGSMGIYVMMFALISTFESSEVYNLFFELFTTSNFYVGSVLAVTLSCFSYMACTRYESLVDISKHQKFIAKGLMTENLLSLRSNRIDFSSNRNKPGLCDKSDVFSETGELMEVKGKHLQK